MENKWKDRKCPGCKKMFPPKKQNQEYCGRPCYIEWLKYNTNQIKVKPRRNLPLNILEQFS